MGNLTQFLDVCYAVCEGNSNMSSTDVESNRRTGSLPANTRPLRYRLTTTKIYIGIIVAFLGFILVFSCEPAMCLGVDAMVSGIVFIIPSGIFGKYIIKYPSFIKKMVYAGMVFMSGVICLNIFIFGIIVLAGRRHCYRYPDALTITCCVGNVLSAVVGLGVDMCSISITCLQECQPTVKSSRSRRRTKTGYKRMHRFGKYYKS